jgi:hypothetical protein
MLSEIHAIFESSGEFRDVFFPITPPYIRSINVGTTLIVQPSQHAHNADQDFLYALDW